jgi:hypothetical protein
MEAKLAPFCKKAKSFFMKLMAREVLKKLLKSCVAQNLN